MRWDFIVGAALVGAGWCAVVSAAPQPVLDVLRPASGHSLVARVGSQLSLAGCTISLRAAARRGDLTRASGGTQVASIAANGSIVSFLSAELPAIAAPRSGRRRVFLRARASCAGSDTASSIASFAPPQSAAGLSVSKWLRRVHGGSIQASDIGVREAFPNLPSFSSPTDIQAPVDGSGRLFVVEQGGKIFSFANAVSASSRTLFLDITSLVETGGQEQGLLGLAFHPQFAQNGRFFVHYSKKGNGNTQLARYTVDAADPSRADPSSAELLLEVAQPFENHNGGQIAFGPDGFLYIGLGDGGSGGDPNNNGQNKGVLLGKLLRIDVDSAAGGLKYGIPAGNPFVGQSGARGEIYAYGLRNPWRFSFDPPTRRLWLADVGQDRFEEVDLIKAGGNYGWRLMEALECYNPSSACDRRGLTLPLVQYSHEVGESITGGYVYRGSAAPALRGLFLYGDFESGRLWGLRYAGGKGMGLMLGQSGLNPSTFGRDPSGEVFVASYSDGRIYKLN